MHMDSTQVDYQKQVDRIRAKLLRQSGLLYFISDRITRRLLHITASQTLARNMQDQRFGALRMHLHSLADLPEGYDHLRPWLAVCPRSYKLQMAGDLPRDAADYELLSHKCWALEVLLERVAKFHTHALQGDLVHQQRIYDHKAAQARLVLAGTDDFALTYHVHDWSEISGRTLHQAAKDIVFRHEEADIALNQIEHIRLRYQQRIMTSTDRAELPYILHEFKHESETNGRV